MTLTAWGRWDTDLANQEEKLILYLIEEEIIIWEDDLTDGIEGRSQKTLNIQMLVVHLEIVDIK